jgi:hypothetical protein
MSRDKEKNPFSNYFVFLGLGILLVIILWSVVTETLIPFYRNGDYEEFWYNISGIPLLLIGTGIFAYGGWLFYRDTRELFLSPRILDNVDIIRGKTACPAEIKKAKTENRNMLFSAWRKGSVKLLIGALLIVCGGIIINLKKIL